MLKKIILSLLSGLGILIITWFYQNYDYTLNLEDGFFKKLWKFKTFANDPQRKSSFVFINTGKDPAIVEDTIDYGTVVVSDREKIYQFLHNINSSPGKPLFTVLDIQFYYPYSINNSIDTLMQAELNKNNKTLIAAVKNSDGEYILPLYHSLYGYSDYRTFGSGFNKFRILKYDSMPSIPIVIHEQVDSAVYKNKLLYTTCNNKLSFSAIWPNYYLNDRDVKTNKKVEFARYFNLGEILFDMEANPDAYQYYFNDKIILLGNFETDTHSTPVGKMSGPVLLANIYLTLLNKQHIVSWGFLLTVLAVFSGLSYVAWFKRMPELKFKFKFIFSSYISQFIRSYVSYFGCMFFLSLLCLFAFNVQVALFLPALIFSGIEYLRQKKYRTQN
ncbi:MAG: CHASE2 domain-containing protein [Chitinophagaceae bacterium]|nr:CHASE2 domain-containing protein [Chitinophagaceae bacterium]